MSSTQDRRETIVDASESNLILNSPQAIIHEFSLNTSTHGIPGIARSSSLLNRLYWIICTLVFTGIMIYFISEAIRTYFEYPTLTLVTIKETTIQPFLAVTLCNYSPLQYDRFIEPFLNYTNQLNITNTTNTSIFTEEQSFYIQNFFQFKLNRNETLTDYFFPLKSMLLSCRYNGLNCSSKDFTSFVSSTYGYCYTFNAQSDAIRNGTLYTQTENGRLGIFEVELYIHSHQYVPYLTNGAGIVLGIHPNREMPLLEFNAQYLMPGRKHRIGYSKKEHHRLSEAYQECHVPIPYMLQVTYDRFSSARYDYSEYSCYMVCTQVFIYSKCGCIDPYEWSARAVVLPGTKIVIDALLCNVSDNCVLKAKQEFTASDSLWTDFCSECKPECTTVQYMTTSSSLQAPSKWLLPKIKTIVESSSIPLSLNWSNTWQTEIENNYVALQITVETGRIENYTETPSMSSVDVLSNVGGQTGLWIGISFLSLMEFIEMLFRLSRYGYYTIITRLRNQIQAY